MPERIDEPLCRNDLLRTLGEHSASILHELRAPLAALRAQLQTMERLLVNKGEVSQCERFQLLYAEMERMGSLLNQYLVLAGNKPAQIRKFSLAVLAEETIALMNSLIISRGLNCLLEAEKNLPRIPMDERKIRQILINLLVNAADATPRGGKITVCVDARENTQRLIVSDTGCGMDSALIAHIFEPFFTTKEQGGGLGLAICRQLAQECGGDLTVFSRPEQGSSFILTLPVAEE